MENPKAELVTNKNFAKKTANRKTTGHQPIKGEDQDQGQQQAGEQKIH